LKSKTVVLLLALALSAISFSSGIAAIDPPFGGSFAPAGAKAFFPSWGGGEVVVRLYTDYFCPPCRSMEPGLEPVIRNLVQENAINLTLIDTPLSDSSPLYARFFLHTLAKNPDFHNAIRVRRVLFDAARNNITQKERLEHVLIGNGIAFAPVDTGEVFRRLNEHLKEDKIRETPTCVIVTGDRKELFVGGPAIMSALERLKSK